VVYFGVGYCGQRKWCFLYQGQGNLRRKKNLDGSTAETRFLILECEKVLPGSGLESSLLQMAINILNLAQ
jgi:hypothetical protein